METVLKSEIFSRIPEIDEVKVNAKIAEALQNFDKKIIVLDDDPTGIQTVHGISVYTDWSKESIEAGFKEDNTMFFILTNSRSFTEEETAKAHQEMAANILEISKKVGKDFMVISRGDSTLRGHYPLETKVLKDTLETDSTTQIDGEVLMPIFKEGGRFTIGNVHYVQEGDYLTPAGETEFAKDKTFGYASSNLGDYIEEKTKGQYKAKDVTYISLDSIRNFDIDGIAKQLAQVSNFGKVVVNAVDYVDVKVFSIALIQAMAAGKKFMFRTAAAFTKVIGGISDKALLVKKDLVSQDSSAGGLVIIGSHVKKTTEQFEELRTLDFVNFIEFNHLLVLEPPAVLEAEISRIVKTADVHIQNGETVAVYTGRKRFELGAENKEEELKVAVKISDAVTSIVQRIKVKPSFLIAKGGITSSDVGTKGLSVKKATVAGQVKPGIPVWLTGSESKFPGLPYIIFPGNVGTKTTLKEVVEMLGKQ
ncbi:four-carbon acid sugar kinase family protein [Pelosinus propionicus]|uniref:Uncharacterized conserved protein YgbK, DUF1537 family n=1 Tax=Pelosinus propionicus DSM 13327 TaxID=1123291 RepID=A0A1I4LG97_9FIRM|nr:four-carbon acid sugar kinase family protein [Pelosinus propionicus]SFL90022.1 Uncharacterized conserved protein YgbK, DUF1537 family [Pelosinus propionicus DSM 13327]